MTNKNKPVLATRYGVILADPPWSYSNRGVNGAAAKHYSTLTPQAIKALPVQDYAADDCVLVLWSTNPMLPVALEVMTAWGFEFVTAFPWIKFTGNPQFDEEGEIYGGVPSWGTGFWVRGCSELVLIGRKGHARPPQENFLGLLSDRLKHSRKPESVYQYCESLVGPYLELFAREMRPGWAVWGDEVASTIDLTAWQPETADSSQETAMLRIKSLWRSRQEAFWEIGDLMVDLVKTGMSLMDVYRLTSSCLDRNRSIFWPRLFYKVALTFPKAERRKDRTWSDYRREYTEIVKVKADRHREQRRLQHAIQQSLDQRLARPGESETRR